MYVNQVFKIICNMSVWVLLLLCHLDPKSPINGLNGTTKIHYIQMKRRSRPVVLDQKLTPVPHWQQNYWRGVGITSSLHLFHPSLTKKLYPPRINLSEKWLIEILWKYWFQWLPIMTLMETWTWMNKIILCRNHIMVYMDMEWNSFRFRTNWNTRTTVYICKHMCVH